jgi:hypothetical protein
MLGVWLVVVLVHALIVAPWSASPMVAKLLPVDSANSDPTFRAFRQRLLEAVDAKDADFLLSVVHPQIYFSFGPAVPGRQGFVKEWGLDRPATSEIWDELRPVLSLGVVMTEPGHACAPYVSCLWPESYDPFDYAAVTVRGLAVRERPSRQGKVIDRLSFDLVRVIRTGLRPEEWQEIVTPSGKRGYVSVRFVRSPVDLRASFAYIEGRWLITTLVAGD